MRNSNIKGNWLLFFFFTVLIAGGACTNNNEEVIQSEIIKPGVYTTDITLATEVGKKNNVNTRGLDLQNGTFTTDYPYDYIYIHSADNKENGHKSLRIPLKEVEYCDGCKGIHLEVRVNENVEGYIISNEEGGSITLDDTESVYFSTIETAYWTAKQEGATPINNQDVFVDSDVNEELLRSASIYTKAELIALIQEQQPVIEMSRHCTGFRVYFMFSDVSENGSTNNNLPENFWNTQVPNTSPEDFYIKLYFGPNFCHQYDVLNNKVVENDTGGYYSTNNQKYQPFESVTYSTTGGGEPITFIGFGYETEAYHYLLSPLNTDIPASEFSIYAFIKYKPQSEGAVDESFLTSDEGAKYFRAVIEDITLDPNRIHFIALAFDAEDLKVFTESSTESKVSTRSPWSEPEKIDLKPIKVIVH